MKDVDELTKEDSGCNNYQAELWIAENEEGEEWCFVKDIHWIRKYEQEKKERLAIHGIPIQTKFRRVTSAASEPTPEQVLEDLREQLEYWRSQHNKKLADHLNNASNMDASKEERVANTKSGLRYGQRVDATEHFIEKLEEYIKEGLE